LAVNAAMKHATFLEWLDNWYGTLPTVSLAPEVIAPAGGPQHVVIVVVDLLVGFCREGPLASPRVGALGPKAAEFLKGAYAAGIRNILMASDAHAPDSPEFAAFPPHCVRGTREAETIEELRALPFFSDVVNFPKGSLNVGIEPAFQRWQTEHPEVLSWILIGDCTDLCVYHTAMYLRTEANTRGLQRQIWVPGEQVDTYDLPVDVARGIGAVPHDGDLMHRLFLYHMLLNGISVVRDIQP
jgi:nicotinamidase-related amidase